VTPLLFKSDLRAKPRVSPLESLFHRWKLSPFGKVKKGVLKMETLGELTSKKTWTM